MRRFTFCLLAALLVGMAWADPYRFPGDVFSTGTVTGSAGVTTPNAVTFGWGVLTRYLFTAMPSLSFGQRGIGWDDTHNELAVWDGSGWQDIVPGAGGGTGGGTVTSVALTVPSWLSVSGSPITGSGTLAVTATTGQTANKVMATPDGSTGAISLRSLVANDLPTISIAKGGTGQTSAAAAFNALSPLTTNGDLLYGGSAGAGTRLGGNTGSTRQWLSSTGTGVAANAPQWNALSTGDMPSGWPTLDQVLTNGHTTSQAVTLDGTITVFSGISGTNGSGTDVAGGGVPIYGGQSTGAADGGAISFYSSLTGTVSGTSLNSNQLRMVINAGGTSANTPPGSATKSLLQIGSTALSGGSGSGTFVGMNVPSGFGGDLANYQKNGVSQFKIDNAGNITQNAVKSATVLGTDSNGKLQATATVDVPHGGTGAGAFTTASLIGSDASSSTAALRAIALGTGLSLSGATLNVTVTAEAIGTMKPWPGVASTTPSGWLACDGSAVSRTTYSGLWAIAQANFTANSSYAPFGPGDGSTTFNLPDTRGRMLVGTDASGVNGTTFAFGVTGGAATNSVSGTTASASTGTLITGLWTTGSTGTEFDAFSHPGNTSHTHTFTSNSFTQMNPYLVTNEIIKAQ